MVGPHGVGKTEVLRDLASNLFMRCIVRAPSDFGTQTENAVKAIVDVRDVAAAHVAAAITLALPYRCLF